mmetsp:Transcript_496/g.1153  ORF Transcript_496/g.1153 Transcript_496/m.1153 type:complete len:516 (-) Transcript_496:2239-3786(-)
MAVAAAPLHYSGSWCPPHNLTGKSGGVVCLGVRRYDGGVSAPLSRRGASSTRHLTASPLDIGGGSGSTASSAHYGLRLGSNISARASSAAVSVSDDARKLESIAELHAELPFSREVWSTFMDVYWQKLPVVIRGAIAGFSNPIEADELAGLACEPDFQPRIIKKGEGSSDWALELGPFSEDELKNLPSTGTWCLLVNDLEKHIPEIAEVLDLFDQFPRWRVADVQASVSTNGGSVGAHSDQFDVFLLQADGCKRWSISDSPVYAPDNDDAFFPDIDVRVLKEFQPQFCSLLKPGDILYLPPKVAHHGVAEDCDTVCTTYSIGLLAPSHQELVLSYAQASIDEHADKDRWSDPWLKPQDNVGTISSEAVTQAAEIIKRSMPRNEADIARWFGCHVTAGDGLDGPDIVPGDNSLFLGDQEFLSKWTEEGSLLRRADIRFAVVQDVSDGSLEGCLFFAGGKAWALKSDQGIALAHHIANYVETLAEDFVERTDVAEYEMDSESKALLLELFNSGFIYF